MAASLAASFLVEILGCGGGGTLPPGVVSGERSMSWKEVDLVVEEEGKGESYDVRLTLDPQGDTMTIAAEDDPRLGTYASIPYNAIKSVSYSRSEHPRWKSGAGVAVAAGIFALPIFFMKGKKHWMTVLFEGVPDRPEGFVHLRLDKDNYRPILAAVEGQTGVKVERIEEE
jgi:hypothetical protein